MDNIEQQEQEYAALIGIDWASDKHDVRLREVDSGKEEARQLKHTPEALNEWVVELRGRFGGRKIAICLEQSKGALIYALMGHEFITLYPVNPTSLANYREVFTVSRAKDDPTDAALLMELLLKHRNKLHAWKPGDEDTRMLTMYNEERRNQVDLRTKLELRLQATLTNYFPQALDLLAGNMVSELACALLQKWPTLHALKRAQPKTIRALYYAHNYRRADLIEANIKKIGTAVPLTEDRAIVTALSLTATVLAQQIRTINAAIDQYDQQIARLFRQHPDKAIFDSFPGAGSALAPRLLSAFGTDRDRYSQAKDIQTFSGIAPGTQRETSVNPLAMELPQVHPANLSGVRQLFLQVLALGKSLLRTPARTRQRASSRSPITGLQVAENHLPVLEGS